MTLAGMKFLTSFINVMRPLVVAMELVEGENPSYISAALLHKGGYDRQSMLSAAGKLSCNKTALKRCTRTEILWNRCWSLYSLASIDGDPPFKISRVASWCIENAQGLIITVMIELLLFELLYKTWLSFTRNMLAISVFFSLADVFTSYIFFADLFIRLKRFHQTHKIQ